MSIPDKVTLEAHVRSWDINYIKECNETMNRRLKRGRIRGRRGN